MYYEVKCELKASLNAVTEMLFVQIHSISNQVLSLLQCIQKNIYNYSGISIKKRRKMSTFYRLVRAGTVTSRVWDPWTHAPGKRNGERVGR